MRIRTQIAAAVLAVPMLSAQIMYVGTYTKPGNNSKGIYAYRFDSKTGKMTPLGLMAETPDPSFLALHPNGKWLYAVNEIDNFKGSKNGSISAFSIDRASGKLTLLNTVSSQGTWPCHLIVDHTGKTLLVANYNSGNFAALPILGDGKLGEATSVMQDEGSGPDRSRQAGPHAHSVNLPKNNKFVLGADLGLDKVMVFSLDAANAKLTAATPPFGSVKPGVGPRHLVFAPDQKHVYTLNEMGSSVSTLSYDANTGAMRELSVTSALPADFKGKSTGAEIQIDAAGKHIYTSNRGHDSIAVFTIDPATAMPKLQSNALTNGKTPRGFVLDPSGHWLVAGNQDSNSMQVFSVDTKTGDLKAADKLDQGAPVSFVFLK